ncbi:DUF1450 domain-containing protein [Treponema sp. OMZ 840]|uniref:NAD(P)H-dependent oxidoreductase subunit E n=1 Tax=Treponema sp. OMZ 840 TaxID=244313 RepID=UPI003D90FF35
MKKTTLSICTGTACYVMGASEFLVLDDHLPADLKDKVEITGVTCLDKCKDAQCGKPPFVLVDGELIAEATVQNILEKIREKQC